jgi:uncharacterized protein (TIGR02597 family)
METSFIILAISARHDKFGHPINHTPMATYITSKIFIKNRNFSCSGLLNCLVSPLPQRIPKMRRSVPLFILAAFAAFASFASAQSVTTDPVGFITLNVTGPAATGGSAISLLGVGFTQPVSYQATLASASGTTLTDSSATWSDNQFNGANGAFYVELISGTGAGRMSQITATTAASKSITTADDLSSFVSAGTGYKIRKNWTLTDFFGPNANMSLVLTGGTLVTADEVLIYRPTASPAPRYDTYYYKTSGLGGTGWRSTASTSTPADTTPLLPTDGIIIRRHTAGNVSFALAGAVKLGQTALPVLPGINLLSNVYPSGTFTLASSNLLGSGLTGGTLVTADQVLIYNITTNPPQYDTYYYKTSGLGGTGWRSTASTSTPADTTPIPFGASIIIQRINPGSFTWVAPQPF